jgi:hypothetical protein
VGTDWSGNQVPRGGVLLVAYIIGHLGNLFATPRCSGYRARRLLRDEAHDVAACAPGESGGGARPGSRAALRARLRRGLRRSVSARGVQSGVQLSATESNSERLTPL